MAELHAVTGAFGFSGKYIAAELQGRGYRVRTLTNARPPADGAPPDLEVCPLRFDDPGGIVRDLRGVSVLHNTYWVRFNHERFRFEDAVRNSRVLFDCARKAGVQRIVHLSITNPDETSPYEYFRGKARVEASLHASGVSYAILRPAVIYGQEGLLLNNIAWMLRRFPVFGVFGGGAYRIQPIHVEDLARLAVEQSCQGDSVIVNAIGPETFTYRELVAAIGEAIGVKRPMIRIPAFLGLATGRLMGLVLRDVVLTREEIGALMEDYLCVDAPPAGTTQLTEWLHANRDWLGMCYQSELARRDL